MTVQRGGGRTRSAEGDSSLVTNAPFSGSVSRRRFLALAAAGTAAGVLLPSSLVRARAQTNGIRLGPEHLILPRDVWGADLPPKGDVLAEAREDVRFLLVHHSASPNEYSADESIGYLRSFYRYHTSSEKGWPDIAYNFLVDRHGQIFEGRQGSIDSPVRGDATGGSQGFALLTCFIGDHSDVTPTQEAQAAMVALLAWLGGTYQIDTKPGATAEFVSRGSNLHPEGKLLTTPTITGHRTMSRTTCPGDRAFDLVENSIPQQVTATLSAASSVTTVSEVASVASTAPSVSTTQAASQPASTTTATTQQAVADVPRDTPIAPAATVSAQVPVATEGSDPDRAGRETSLPETSAGSVGLTPVSRTQEPAPAGRESARVLGFVGVGICAAGVGAELLYRRFKGTNKAHLPDP